MTSDSQPAYFYSDFCGPNTSEIGVTMLVADDLTLRGASGAEHVFKLQSLRRQAGDQSAVYVLLSRHTDHEGHPKVLYVGETPALETSLASHRDYPCMEAFVGQVGSAEVVATERSAVANDVRVVTSPPCEGCWPPLLPPVSDDRASPGLPPVVGDCVTERMLLDIRLEDAIHRRMLIRFVHDGRVIAAEPHEYGLTPDAVPVVSVYLTGHGAGKGPLGAWRVYPLSEISGLVVTDRPFGGARPTTDTPIAVTFAGKIGRSRPTWAASPEAAGADLLEPLRRETEDLVRKLRDQVYQLQRVAAREARLRLRREQANGLSELDSVLAGVESDRTRISQEIMDLIPMVSKLQVS